MIENFDAPHPNRPKRLAAVVLDWAGTTVDFGSRAPVAAMRAAFKAAGVPVSEAEARRPMGMAKRDHLQAMLSDLDVADRWRATHGRAVETADVDKIYNDFLVLQADTVADYSALIPGCLAAVAECRALDLKIGSSTGYTRELLSRVAARASDEGYSPDVMLSADDISPGRPAPWLLFENARRMNTFPMSAVLKVDDTPAGVAAGRNAGAWSVGVVQSGNEIGLSQEALEALSSNEREAKYRAAAETLRAAGAHALIDTIADLPAVVRRINQLLEAGEVPR
jgi:phosphonoacetaldehyde hydrolase